MKTLEQKAAKNKSKHIPDHIQMPNYHQKNNCDKRVSRYIDEHHQDHQKSFL